MFEKFWKYNIKLSPLHIFLSILLLVNIMMSATRQDYFFNLILMALPQLWVISIIPNLIYYVRNRKETGSLQAFLTMVVLLPIPYLFIIIIMRIIYV